MAAHCTQFLLAILLLRWSTGATAVHWFSEQLIGFINYGLVGSEFVFGESFEDHYFGMAVSAAICQCRALHRLSQ
jgi:nucleoside permease NupC